MTRWILFLCGVAAVSLIVWMAGHALMTPPRMTESTAPWPYALGTLNDLPKRYPAHDASANAQEIVRIAAKLDVDVSQDPRHRTTRPVMQSLRSQFIDYLAGEVKTDDDTIGEPPAKVQEYLASHRAAIDELREQLIANAEPRWTSDVNELWEPPQPNVSGHFDLYMILATDALEQRRTRHDDLAWQDLEAIWKLVRGVWAHPGQVSGASGMRLMNDVAWKMGTPPPAWWREVTTFNIDRAVTSAMQYDVWRTMQTAERFPAGEPEEASRPKEMFRRIAAVLTGPMRLRRAEAMARSARIGESAFATTTNCAESSVLHRRARRFIAEREGTAKFLALKAAGWPSTLPGIEHSDCSDRTWRYENGRLSISAPIPLDQQQRIVLPLSWRHR